MAVRKPFIGQMDTRIEIFELVKVQNSIGELIEEKKLITRCWSKIDSDTGSENVEGNVRHLSNKKFTIRFNKKVLEKGNEYLVGYNNIFYSITHVAEIGRKSHLQLICFNYV